MKGKDCNLFPHFLEQLFPGSVLPPPYLLSYRELKLLTFFYLPPSQLTDLIVGHLHEQASKAPGSNARNSDGYPADVTSGEAGSSGSRGASRGCGR